MIEIVLMAIVVIILAVNGATTVSPKFRRWLYSKEK